MALVFLHAHHLTTWPFPLAVRVLYFFPAGSFHKDTPVQSQFHRSHPLTSLSLSLSPKMRFLSILRFPQRMSGSSGRGFRRAERRSIRRSRTEKERSRLTLLGDFVGEGGGWRHEGGEGRWRENGAFPGDSSEKRRAQAWLRADMPGYEREKMMRRRVAPAFYPLPFACDPVDRDSKPRLHDLHRTETTSGLYPLVIMLCTSVNWIQLSRNSLASFFHTFHLLQLLSYFCFLSFRMISVNDIRIRANTILFYINISSTRYIHLVWFFYSYLINFQI